MAIGSIHNTRKDIRGIGIADVRCSVGKNKKKGNPEYALRQKGKVAELALGYQGSSGALINMGALDMGIPEEDLPDIVSRWREANKRIRDLWYKTDTAAVQVITQGGSVGVNGVIISREFNYSQNTDYMTIALPSGRKLCTLADG